MSAIGNRWSNGRYIDWKAWATRSRSSSLPSYRYHFHSSIGPGVQSSGKAIPKSACGRPLHPFYLLSHPRPRTRPRRDEGLEPSLHGDK